MTTAHSGHSKGRGQVEACQSARVVKILCRAITLQALRGLVGLKWALGTSSYNSDCCSLEMAYTWLSTSYVCPVSCAMLLSSSVLFAGD